MEIFILIPDFTKNAIGESNTGISSSIPGFAVVLLILLNKKKMYFVYCVQCTNIIMMNKVIGKKVGRSQNISCAEE